MIDVSIVVIGILVHLASCNSLRNIDREVRFFAVLLDLEHGLLGFTTHLIEECDSAPKVDCKPGNSADLDSKE